MKKNTLKVLSVLALVSAGAATLVGCGKGQTDSKKTQLYVLNYQGGYGKKYIENAARRYEALHANDSYQEGKTGVEIIIQEEKSQPNMATLRTSNYNLIIFEGMVYKTLMDANICADITKYVNQDNPYEQGKTIESKMYDEQKSFFNDNGKYYVIPNYVGSFGIVYNKTVFEEQGLYFNSNYQSEEPGTMARFGGHKLPAAERDVSLGRDGIAGTVDDGLPVTYEEFYELCNYIDGFKNMTPMIWMGKNSYNYLTELNSSMICDYDGYDAYKTNYLMDGTFKAVKLKDNTIEFDKDGKPVTENVTVHPDKVGDKYDGYEVQRSASKYYAFDFMRNIIDHKYGGQQSSSGVWAYDLLNDSDDNFRAQANFIFSQFGVLPTFDTRKANKPVAMLLEGNWWENEAENSFAELSTDQKSKCDYGWMTLPMHETATSNKPTTLNSLTSYMFVKSGMQDYQTQLAADFLQYLNTDEAYREFTVLTGAIKSYKYQITADDKSKMTGFGRDFWDYFQASDKVFPESHNNQFKQYLSDQQLSRRYFTTSAMSWPSKNFESDNSETAGTYLNKMYKYYKTNVWKVTD